MYLNELFALLDEPSRPILDAHSDVPDFILSIMNTVWAFIKWFVFVFMFFTPVFFGVSKPVSQSMTPTCFTHDILISAQMCYGIKIINFLSTIPIPGLNLISWSGTLFEKSLLQYKKPQLGDVIVFRPIFDKESIWCKRILGCPGDKVQFRGGILFLNDQPAKMRYLGKYSYVQNEKFYSGDLYEEELSNGVKHQTLYYRGLGGGDFDNTEPFVIPAGHYFGVGDNRHDSLDSRGFLGVIPEQNIFGRGILILLSNGNLTTLNYKSLKSIRWDKCITWMK